MGFIVVWRGQGRLYASPAAGMAANTAPGSGALAASSPAARARAAGMGAAATSSPAPSPALWRGQGWRSVDATTSPTSDVATAS